MATATVHSVLVLLPSSAPAPRPFAACWLAWSQLRIRIRHLFEKHYDEHSGYHYYVHKKTGESTWQKPLLLGAEDLDDGKDVEPPKGSFVRSFVLLSSGALFFLLDLCIDLPMSTLWYCRWRVPVHSCQ